jgi:oxygen-independent coproporphyrinogen-3 oxidase
MADARTTAPSPQIRNSQSAIRNPQSVYIHVPFCAHRCGYCNFTLVAGRDDLIPAYLQAIELELQRLETPREVDTIFLGGGTPSHLDAANLEMLLRIVAEWFPLRERGEFSAEANPADLDDTRTAILANAGVTRISLGAQSFDDNKLRVLERDHAARDIVGAVDLARRYHLQVSLDLIFAVPGETLAGWQQDLREAVQLEVNHISTYGLTFEQGTAFWTRRMKGELLETDESDELAMYELAIDQLESNGFEQYEISNFAQPGFRCRHNEAYWTGEQYYAAGPGAARFVDDARETNHRSTSTYIRRMLGGQSPVAEREDLTAEDHARERLIFGLRRLEGIELETFQRQTGYDVDALAGEALERFVAAGLLARSADRLRLTRRGLVVSDSLWPDLL